MKNAALFALFLCISVAASAQTSADTITVKRSILGTYFIANGKALRPRQMLEITKSNPEAYRYMQKAKTNYDIGLVIGMAGGFMVGYPLGTAIAGGDANWTLAGVGAGLIVVSLPLNAGYLRNAKNAARIYNAGLQKTGLRDRRELRFEMGANGVGIRLGF